MASPTEDEIQTQINRFIYQCELADTFLRDDAADDVSSRYDAFVEGAEGDYQSAAIAGYDNWRAQAAALTQPGSMRAVLDPLLLEYAKQQGFPEQEAGPILDRLATYFGEGSERVTSRTFTYGTPSAGGSNVGNGSLERLTIDRLGFAAEAATAETKTFRCIQDRHSGATVHSEIFEIRGQEFPRDTVAGVVGGDRSGALTTLSADASRSFIQNPSFNGYSGTAPDVTTINGWTPTSAIGNFQIETSDVYKTSQHEGDNPGALRIETNDTLTQSLTIQRARFNPRLPYYCQIAFKRESSADGTLTIRVGSNSKSVTLSAQSGWTILKLDLDTNLFFENWNETTLDIEIQLASNTTGTVLVDDLIFGPMTAFDGTFWAFVGGATPFLVNDTYTAADSISSDSILQKWLWRAYGRSLPHDTTASGNVTWSEPS